MQRLVAQLTTYVILSTRYYFIRYEWINLIQVSLFLSYKKELSSIYIEFSKTRSSTIRFYVLMFYSWNFYWKYRDGKIEILNELLSTKFCSSGCIRCLQFSILPLELMSSTPLISFTGLYSAIVWAIDCSGCKNHSSCIKWIGKYTKSGRPGC